MTCRLCGGRTSPHLVSWDRNRGDPGEVFGYVRCEACASILIDPVPADLSRYYRSDYYTPPATPEALAAGAEPERYKVDLLASVVQRGRVLEVGPGNGGFVYLAQAAGYEVEAIEMDEAASAHIRATTGARVVQSAAPAAVLGEGGDNFDAVVMWHVVEHLPDPFEVLEAAAGRLNPGGALVVAMPNPEAIQFRLFARRWTHLDAPRHLQLMRRGFLASRLVALGLEVVLDTSTDPGGLGWDRFGWHYSIANLLASLGLPRYRTIPVLIPVAYLAAWLASPLERRHGRGTTYTMVARRPL